MFNIYNGSQSKKRKKKTDYLTKQETLNERVPTISTGRSSKQHLTRTLNPSESE